MKTDVVIFELLSAAFNQVEVVVVTGGYRCVLNNIFQVFVPQTDPNAKMLNSFRASHANVDTTGMMHEHDYVRVRTKSPEDGVDADCRDFLFDPTSVQLIEITSGGDPL